MPSITQQLTTQEQRILRALSKSLDTLEGKKRIVTALKKADRENAQFREDARVDPEILAQPFTI